MAGFSTLEALVGIDEKTFLQYPIFHENLRGKTFYKALLDV